MTKAFRSVTLFSLLCFLTLGVAWGQQGLNPADAQFTQDFGTDSINLQNLSLSVSAPVISKAGMIPFDAAYNAISGCQSTMVGGVAKAECTITALKYAVGSLNGAEWEPFLDYPYSAGVNWGTLGAGVCATDGKAYNIFGSLFISANSGTTYYLPTGVTVFEGASGPTACDSGHQTGTVLNGNIKYDVWPNPLGGFIIEQTLTYPNGYITPGATGYVQDPFGNKMTSSILSGLTTITDTLGNNTFTTHNNFSTTIEDASYKDTGGVSHTVGVTLTANNTIKTAFGCAAAPDQTLTGKTLATAITYPDGHNIGITYEPITGGVTGRISALTLRTTGAITYSYGAMNCASFIPSSLTRHDVDGDRVYTFALNGTHGTKTTVLDPGKNQTVYYFQGTSAAGLPQFGVPLTLTEVQVYQNTGTVASPVNTLLSTTIYCYNNNATACPTTQAAYPILHKDVYVAPGAATTYSRTHYDYDTGCSGSCGLVTNVVQYASFVAIGAGTADNKTAITYGSWNGTNCVGIGSGIINKPCRVQTTDNATPAHVIADTTYSYLFNGFLSGENHWSGSAWLTTMTASANGNGTVNQRYNSLGTPTTYTYALTGSGGCNAMLPTGTSTTIGSATLTTGASWDCNMGKLLSATDANSHTSNFTYDLLGRPASEQDPANLYTLSESYPSATSSTLTDSTYFTTTLTVDGLGRPIRSQRTDGASYDTVSIGRGFNGTQFQLNTSEPCISALNADCTINHFSYVDPLGRNIYAATTSNETINTSFNLNDVSTTLSPAPSGENTKTSQSEYDGMGRVISTCAVQSSGGTACSMADGNSGIFVQYAYSYGSGQTTVNEYRGTQTHTTVYDAMGRPTSVTTPESGTTTYIYDQASASCSSGSAPGFLLEIVDSAGLHTCMGYDAIGRPTNTFVAGTSNPCRVLVYGDQYSGTPSITNANNRIAEAWTDSNCTGGSKITNEYFSYDADGRTIDVYETTPHSGGQYHSTAAYAVNGQLTSLSGVPGASAYTIVLDSNGRPYTSKYGTTVVGNGTTYNAAGQTKEIDTGTGSDKDVYTYDANTGLMKTWAFTINSISENATLTWNTNRTLKTLAITDGFNAGGTQTCHYNPTDAAGSGYDDVGRLVGVNCGAVWTQTYTYDQYNNFSKSGTTNWNPGYSATNNHITGAGYDSDGQVTYDLNNSYAWDGYHKMTTANAGASLGSCGAAGVTCITYDAFGRPAEKNVGGTITEMLYSPIGLTGIMSGQTANNFRVRIPGGAIFDGSVTNGNLVSHVDWLGSARAEYSLGHACKLDTAYSPYGEKYANFCNAGYVTFTGDYQNLYSGLYDTPNREFDTSSGSRWLSPDPARASWNAYSYPTNPNSMTDPSGLDSASDSIPSCQPGSCILVNVYAPMVSTGCDGGYGCGTMTTDYTQSVGNIINVNGTNYNFYTGQVVSNGLQPIVTRPPVTPPGLPSGGQPKKGKKKPHFNLPSIPYAPVIQMPDYLPGAEPPSILQTIDDFFSPTGGLLPIIPFGVQPDTKDPWADPDWPSDAPRLPQGVDMRPDVAGATTNAMDDVFRALGLTD